MPWRRSRRPISFASASITSGSLIGGGEPSTSGLEPAMWPRACAFGPRTSPTTRSGSPSRSRSQPASTTAGCSDIGEEVRERRVELVRLLETRQMPCPGEDPKAPVAWRRRQGRARRPARPARKPPSHRATRRARTNAVSRPRSRATTRAAVPTSARPAEIRAEARPSSVERGGQLELRGDRRALAQLLEPGRERLVGLEVDAEIRAGAQDPRHVADVAEAVRPAAQERLRLERRIEVTEPLVELRLVTAAKRVVIAAEAHVEPVEPEPAERTLRRVDRPERRLGEALLEILHDHQGLREDETALLLEHRHLPAGVLGVQPGGAVGKVYLGRLVTEALLRQDDPRPGAVRAAGCVVQDHAAETSGARSLERQAPMPRLRSRGPRRSGPLGRRSAPAGPAASRAPPAPRQSAPLAETRGGRRPSGGRRRSSSRRARSRRRGARA